MSATGLVGYLEQRFPKGLSYDDAAQLCLHLYCTVGDLPEPLRENANKHTLADTFAALAKWGWVKDQSSPFQAAYGANHHAVSDRGHWVEIIASIFKKGNTVNEARRKELALQLRNA